jgi:hypothetical protein
VEAPFGAMNAMGTLGTGSWMEPSLKDVHHHHHHHFMISMDIRIISYAWDDPQHPILSILVFPGK